MTEQTEQSVDIQSLPSRSRHLVTCTHLDDAIAEADAVSSEDDAVANERLQGDEAGSLVGVSIGTAQTRLKSPNTPAAEKAAVLAEAGGYFGDAFGGSSDRIAEKQEEELDDEARGQHFAKTAGNDASLHDPKPLTGRIAQQQVNERSSTEEPARLPSPWRAGPKKADRSDQRKSILHDGGIFNRRRAASGPEEPSGSWHKSIVASLPSLPKNFSLISPFGSSRGNDRPDGVESGSTSKDVRNPTLASNRLSTRWQPITRDSGSAAVEYERSGAGTTQFPPRPTPHRVQSQASSHLRRSASDGSLVASRTLSRVSSLGDDSRFEHVSEQVNSRFKAIRDSWQDANIKLPSLPTVASLRYDFLGSKQPSRKPSEAHAEDYRGSLPAHSTAHPKAPVDPMTRQPYTSARDAAHDVTSDRTSHPNLKRALLQLEGDVVVLGGYRGSILRSAEPPHRQLWVPIKVGLNMRKVDLEVGINPGDDERAAEKVIPGEMLSHIGPVDISRRLLKRLHACENSRCGKLRVHNYGYDWRLDPTYLSTQLQEFLLGLPCNQPGVSKEQRGAIVIAHSLGGLITRHVVNRRPELFRGIVYAGVPNTCVNILGPLRKGDDVLLSNRVLTAQVNFTIRTSLALLPLDGRCFFDKNTGEEYPVDFFDVQTWIHYRLSPCVARPLPPLHPKSTPSGITGYVSSMANALAMPGRHRSQSRGKSPLFDVKKQATVRGSTEPDMATSTTEPSTANDSPDPFQTGNPPTETNNTEPSPATTVTIPRDEAIAYLTRTLSAVKKFKQNLAFHPPHASSNLYPPISLIYGKSIPTVYGAKVDGRNAIRHADAYDDLAFASGDGVVLARAAMVPDGYAVAKGGVVSSERGHVTLLGDLEAVGRCLNAVVGARRRGIGMGV